MNVDSITTKTLALKPSRVALWLIAGPFVVVGVALRLLWLAPAFLISSAVEGWQVADRAYQAWRGQPR